MIRREELVKVGGYRVQARHAEDFDLWLRLAVLGEIHVLPDLLLNYRIHSGQITSHLAFPDETRQAIAASRLALAEARHESSMAARFRQASWVAINRAKGR